MNVSTRKIEWMLWFGLALVVATIFLALLLARIRVRPSAEKPLPINGSVADFGFTNQLGQPVGLADLRGHIWVADIIFTRCAGPCLRMSRLMKQLQESLPPDSPVRLVSFTTDPENDTPAALKTYAERFGADPRRWWFLTGAKQEIRDLETRSLKLTALEKKPEDRESPADLFIHSTLFLVIDKNAQWRAVIETTGEGIDPKTVQSQLSATIRQLQRER